MEYQSIKIKEVINELNEKFFLPHIQRSLVWKETQILRLFDSLMRGYPISTFLFWKVRENKSKVTKLDFIKNYKRDDKNEINNNIDKDEYWLILDGQQRLQSFYIALKGSYNKKELYFNVFSEHPIIGEDLEDENDEILYEFKFIKDKGTSLLEKDDEKTPNKNERKLWVKVKDFGLLGHDRGEISNPQKIEEFIERVKNKYSSEISHKEANLLSSNIRDLHTILTKTGYLTYYLEAEPDYERVLDIFIRTNSGGTKLTKSDLLFSMIKLNWKRDALNEFNNLLEEINRDQFRFNNDFILKTSLMVAGDSIAYKVENVKKNITNIEKEWDKIRNSIAKVIDLLELIGISNDKSLPSKNAIIPILYFTYKQNIQTYNTNRRENAQNVIDIKKWLYNSLLNNIFSGNSDVVLKACKDVLNETAKEFPYHKLNAEIEKKSNRAVQTSEERISEIKYGDSETNFVLGLLYPDINFNPASKSNELHIDHIFPQSLLDKRYSKKLINNIGNLQLLTAFENESKNNQQFDKWIKDQNDSFLDKHKIPRNKGLWKIDKFEEFLVERRKLIIKSILEQLK